MLCGVDGRSDEAPDCGPYPSPHRSVQEMVPGRTISPPLRSVTTSCHRMALYVSGMGNGSSWGGEVGPGERPKGAQGRGPVIFLGITPDEYMTVEREELVPRCSVIDLAEM